MMNPIRSMRPELLILSLCAAVLSPCALAQAPAAAPSPQPQRVYFERPAFPQKALAEHQGGRVTVRFQVDARGRPQDVRIVSATPKGLFERVVRGAVRRWRYAPGKPGEVLEHFRFVPPAW